ncbi:MAG: sulfatase [Planctomycetes bacterium]|nr:sulfatase [Planctomycetota bacterium]
MSLLGTTPSRGPGASFALATLLLPAVLLWCATLSFARPGEGERKPNVVLIVADDLGYADLGVQGARDVRTPNLDRLAAEGVRFTAGYVTAPLCAPSRAALLTGRYGQRFGLETNPGSERDAAAGFGVPRDEPMLAERLKAAGYATAIVGKWHVGYEAELRPQRRGFDSFFGFLSGSSRYVARNLRNPILRGDEPTKVEGYLTDAFTREAVEFIGAHAEQPFFLYVPFNAVHVPLEAPEPDRERFAGISDEKRRTFAVMLSKLDSGVGAILAALDEKKLSEDTLVIFLSDNGGATAENTSRNAPLRGEKPELYEGGVRVPFLVRWTGKLKAGTVEARPVSSLDVVPTVLAAAGLAKGGGRPDGKTDDKPLDGVDLVPFLTGKSKARPHDALFWRIGKDSAARVGDWKLVVHGDQTELYDLTEDLAEKTNLAKRRPEVVAKLRAAYEAWERQLVAPRWTPTRGAGDE